MLAFFAGSARSSTLMAVAIVPGRIELQRIPWGPREMAQDSIKPGQSERKRGQRGEKMARAHATEEKRERERCSLLIPALVGVYAVCCPPPTSAEMDEMAMMDPPGGDWVAIWLATAWVTWNVPSMLTA